VFLSFKTRIHDDPDDDNNDRYDYKLVFNINAPYKDPMLIKSGTHFMGFVDK
jgi:hypothetical protein